MRVFFTASVDDLRGHNSKACDALILEGVGQTENETLINVLYRGSDDRIWLGITLEPEEARPRRLQKSDTKNENIRPSFTIPHSNPIKPTA